MRRPLLGTLAPAFSSRAPSWPWRPLYMCCYCCLNLSPFMTPSSALYQQNQQHPSSTTTRGRTPMLAATSNPYGISKGGRNRATAAFAKTTPARATRTFIGGESLSVVRAMHTIATSTARPGNPMAASRMQDNFIGAGQQRQGSTRGALINDPVTGSRVSCGWGAGTSGLGAVRQLRTAATGRSVRRGRGWGGAEGPLYMGKGTERKQIKKAQAAALKNSGGKRGNAAKGAATAAAQGRAAPAAASLGPEPVLAELTDVDGFLQALEYFRKAKAPRRVLKVFEASQKRGLVEASGSLAAAAIKVELKLDREDLARDVIAAVGEERFQAWLKSDLEGAQAVVRIACSTGKPELAENLMMSAGLSCEDAAEQGLDGVAAAGAASVYPNLITAYSRIEKRSDAMRLLESLAQTRVAVKVTSCNRLLRGFQKRRDLEAVFKVLDAMAAAGVDGDEETFEWISNAAVRNVEFVTLHVDILLRDTGWAA